MSLPEQIFWGSVFLGVCVMVQAACIGMAAHVMVQMGARLRGLGRPMHLSTLLAIALVAIIGGLTAQVWIWAWIYVRYDVLMDWNSAVYFSLVTFTSLGYGDIVVVPEYRIFAAFGSVTGLLSFGIGTAFLVAAMSRRFGERHDRF
ncbi:MAG: potassium channel family protein [Paracoccaceae bacterium]